MWNLHCYPYFIWPPLIWPLLTWFQVSCPQWSHPYNCRPYRSHPHILCLHQESSMSSSSPHRSSDLLTIVFPTSPPASPSLSQNTRHWNCSVLVLVVSLFNSSQNLASRMRHWSRCVDDRGGAKLNQCPSTSQRSASIHIHGKVDIFYHERIRRWTRLSHKVTEKTTVLWFNCSCPRW